MKRNSLTTAVLAGLTGIAGMAGVANAVNVNPDGLGQVLLFPYYTAREGNDTYISIVNTADVGKAVKIRFIESLNSREVLDFNIYMSPFDVWAAVITKDDSTGGGRVVFDDTTCTAPYLVETVGGSQEFLTAEFIDGGPEGADRTKSGYIEVIEMGTLIPGEAPAIAAKHVNGVPPDSGTVNPRTCGLFTEWWIDESFANGTGQWVNDAGDGIGAPTGGLFGSGTVLNVDSGAMYPYNAVAIDGFWGDAGGDHTDPASLEPSLANADTTSIAFINGAVSEVTWDIGVQAVNAAITLSELYNEYMIEEGVMGATEWVLTFPTKRFHVNVPTDDDVIPPFTEAWNVASPVSCDVVDFQVYDREEQTPDPDTGGVIVSPQRPGPEPEFELCREVNIVRFSNDGSLPAFAEISGEPSAEEAERPAYGYVNLEIAPTANAIFENGWAAFDLRNFESAPALNPAGATIRGLPVIGFSMTRYANQDVGGLLANYGQSFEHRGSRQMPEVPGS